MSDVKQIENIIANLSVLKDELTTKEVIELTKLVMQINKRLMNS